MHGTSARIKGEAFMDEKTAARAKQHALAAIVKLHTILKDATEYEAESNKLLKRGIGLAIGSIEIDLLGEIYRQYPELDDLKDISGAEPNSTRNDK
jgi:hypothetical protein